MTPIQLKIHRFIQSFIEEHGYAPLLKEIAIGVGISPKSKSFISRCVRSLQAQGLLELENKGHPRNIKLITDQKSDVSSKKLSLPLMGRIAAGAPIEAITQNETIDLGALLLADDHFVLEVKGDSMIEEGILNGDKVICKQQVTAKEGDIVIALINNYEATLKRIHYKPKDKITLTPANAKLTPQVYDKSQVQIQGIFIGLLRTNLNL